MKRLIPVIVLTLLSCFSGMAMANGQHSFYICPIAGGSVKVMIDLGEKIATWTGEVSLSLDTGTVVQIVAVPNTGWHFVGWVGDGGYQIEGLDGSPAFWTITNDLNVYAVFEQNQQKVVVTSGPGGTVVTPPVGTSKYPYGRAVILKARANDGYRFSRWTGSAVDSGAVDDPNEVTTFMTVTADCTLQANFKSYDVTLTVSSGTGGTVLAPGVGTYTYAGSSVIPIAAQADANYHFTGWTGSAVDALKVANPASANTMVTMDDSYSLVANFANDQHALAISWSSGGSVETVAVSDGVRKTWTTQGSFLVDSNTKVRLTAIPASGWAFSHWSGAPEAAGNSVGFTMTEDRNIQAFFVQDSRTLVVTSGDGGTVKQPGVGTFTYQRGTPVKVEAVANTGYRFTEWTGSVIDTNDIVNAKLSLTTVTLNQNSTLHANFELLPQGLNERWQQTPATTYTPSVTALIGGDDGFWTLTDGYSDSSATGTPQRATILTMGDDRALKLASVPSGSKYSDRISVLRGASNDPAPWAGVAICPNTVISFDEIGGLNAAAMHVTTSKDGMVLPAYDNVSVILTDNHNNVLVYVLQRYAGATPNVGATGLSDTYLEIFLDATAIKYQRNLFSDFSTIPAFQSAGAVLKSLEFRVDAHGTAIIDNILVGPGAVVQKTPIYRFWSPSMEDHFYTASQTERKKLLADSTWVAEDIAFFALPYGVDPNTKPVYRFWSHALQAHFYTISSAEKDRLIQKYADSWTYEGIYFYVYPEGSQPADAVPVYRFWSDTLNHHFYTAKTAERDKLMRMDPPLWTYEGIAWYAYAPWSYSSLQDTLASQ
jgi:hypothetical protein